MLGNEKEGWQGKGTPRAWEAETCVWCPRDPGFERLEPEYISLGGWVAVLGTDGVYKQWAEMGVGQDYMERAEESRFLIYYLWALKCKTTRQK